MALKEKFMFQNLAYRPTVYRTGTFSFRLVWQKMSYGHHKLGGKLVKLAMLLIYLWSYSVKYPYEHIVAIAFIIIWQKGFQMYFYLSVNSK